MAAVKKMYWDLYNLYVKAHPEYHKEKCQNEVNAQWRAMKQNGKDVDLELYNREIMCLENKLNKKKNTMFDFLLKVKKKPLETEVLQSSLVEPSSSIIADSFGVVVRSSPDLTSTPDLASVSSVQTASSGLIEGEFESSQVVDDEELSDLDHMSDEEPEIVSGRIYTSPAQNRLKDELTAINSRISSLNEARNLGIGEENVHSLTKQIKEMTETKNKVVVKLKRLKVKQKAQQKLRDNRKKAIANVCKEYPSISSKIKCKDIGRPPVGEIYPNLHHDLLQIATIGAAASDKR